MLRKFRSIVSLVTGVLLGISSLQMQTSYADEHPQRETEAKATMFGDANCDEKVDIGDVVFVMQSIFNPDEFGLNKPDGITSRGQANADVYRNGDGLTMYDATTVLEYIDGTVDKLPVSYKDGRIIETTGSTTTSTTTTTTSTTTTTKKPTTTSTTSTTTTTTTKKPTTTSTTSTTTTTTTKKPTTTSTTSTTTTTTTKKPTTTSTTSTTTTTTTKKPTTTSTTSTTTTTTTKKPTTTSTTSTTTTTTTKKPTTTSTTSTTTTTTTKKPTTTSTTSTTTTTTTKKPTTTSTTSTTTTTTTTTTTNTTTSTTTDTDTGTTVTYFYKYEEGVYWNPDNVVIGPDSYPEMYNGFLRCAEENHFEHFKIVWSEKPIYYAYVVPFGGEDDILQVAKEIDLKQICPDSFYDEEVQTVEDKLKAYSYVLWYPYEDQCSCGNYHEEVFCFTEDCFVFRQGWQLIPCDEYGNDILCLGSNSEFMNRTLSIIKF